MSSLATMRLMSAWRSSAGPPGSGGPLVAVAIAFAARLGTAAPAADPFVVGGHRARQAVAAIGETLDPRAPLDSEMARLAAGVLALYEEKAIPPLLACRAKREPAADANGRRVAVLHLRAGDAGGRRLEVLRLDDGSYVARALDDPADAIGLDRGRFEAIAAEWPVYRGGFGPPESPLAEPFELGRPYAPGRALDRRAAKQLLYRDLPVSWDDPDRDLDAETMHTRLPAGYDPHGRCGLLVWSSPTSDGRIPAVLGPALDELGFAAIGCDDAGNDRDVSDKFQLVLDAAATAQRRFHVDPDRVYVAGMSGGGKVASVLAVCFPDVFAGAVPIVGFSSYHDLDASFGEHFQRYYSKPYGTRLDLAMQHRMALLGGPADFNHREMAERLRRMTADGFSSLRFFEHDDMGHVMPTAERFAEALRWVDEPQRRRREAEAEEAAAALRAIEADGLPRLRLVGLMELWPWTPAAWRALEHLRR